MRILTVDDEEKTATLVSMQLESEFEASVDIAPDCATARELLSSNSYDLITIDYQLPDGDGLSLLEEILGMENAPPVVILTAHGDEKTAVSAFKLGASGYVVKDARMSTMLVEEARSALARAGQAKAEERYRSVFDNSRNGIAVYETVRDGEDFVFKDFNKAAQAIDRISREDVIGRSVLAVFPGVREFGLFEVFQRVWKTGVPEQHPLSQYADERVSGWRDNYVYRLSSGEVVAVYADVTEQKQAEEKLQRSEELYKKLVQLSPDGIGVVDVEGNVIALSESVSEILGYGLEDLSGTDVFNIVTDNLRDQVPNDLETLRETGRLTGHEMTITRKDGTEVFVEVNASTIKDEDGNPSAIMAVVRDVTERRKAEETLRERETRLEAIYEGAMDAIVLIDSKLIISHLNPAAEKLFGFTAEEALGQSIEIMLPELRLKAHRGPLEEFIHTGQRTLTTETPSEMLLAGKHRTEFPAEVSVSRFQIGGEWYAEVIARDMTERKQAEEALQRANLELEGYAVNLSHDLKGPVGSASLAFSMLTSALEKVEIPEKDGEKLEEIIRAGKGNVNTAYKIIENLLAMAETGEPQEVSQVSIEETIERVLEENAQMIKEKGITVEVASPLGAVVASNTQIYQLFSNLIHNSIEHNQGENPLVEISSLDVDGTTHRFLVRDNGQGIPEEILDDVFIPFVKAQSSGTGIGLSTVEKIVRTYGGEIRAYNDNGACFEFTLRDYSS